MSRSNQHIVHVYYHGLPEKQLAGRLLSKNRQIFFEYDPDFLKTGLELSPFTLPLKIGVTAANNRVFNGLFGIFNDSLPDGWGQLLLNRKLKQSGLNPNMLSPLDHLCFIGQNGMGALSYAPESTNTTLPLSQDLDEIEKEIQMTLDENDFYLDDLLILGGSSGGARPKVLLYLDNKHWLIKFRSHIDPKDISAIEYAYHGMAKEAGLIVPNAKLFSSRKGLGFFGVERFDRHADERIHMHTIAGLLDADHRTPSLDYENIMKATLYLTKNINQCEIQLRHAMFNVLSHNRDDHAKNFAFLMDARGKWTVSPAYDLTFSSGPSGEHATMIMGEGKNPTKAHLLTLAKIGNITQTQALDIFDQVLAATQKWIVFAREAGVSNKETNNIENTLKIVRKNLDLY